MWGAAARREQMLLAVASAANSSYTLAEAAGESMAALTGVHGLWDAAHLLRPAAGGGVECSGVWSFRDGHDAAFGPLVAVRPPGMRASTWKARPEPQWFSRFDMDAPPEVKSLWDLCGVQTMCSVPVLVGEEVVASIALFATRPIAFMTQNIDMLTTVGALLGRVVERERAAAATASALDRVRSVTRVAPEAIVSLDADGVVVAWNDFAQQLFGWTESDMVGSTLAGLFPPHLRDQYRAGLAALISGELDVPAAGSDPTIVHGRHRDGSPVVAEAYVAIWAEQGKPFVTVYLRDRAKVESAQKAALLKEEALLAARHAAELNDEVIQSLVLALYTLEAGDVQEAESALRGTLSSAQALVARLLEFGDSELTSQALLRTVPAQLELDDPPTTH